MTARSFLAPGETPPARPPSFPSKPTPGRPPRRRGLLGAVAALAAVPCGMATARPASLDADLIALCTYIAIAHAETVAAFAAPEGRTEAEEEARVARADLLQSAHADMVERAAKTPAFTLAGVRAKAEAARASAYLDEAGEPDPTEQMDFLNTLAWSGLADMARIGGAA